MTIAELIAFAKQFPDAYVEVGMLASPVNYCSYRGVYQDLAIVLGTKHVTGFHFYAMLEESLVAPLEGYKGGRYQMTPDTQVWVVLDESHASGCHTTGVYFANNNIHILMGR